MRRLLALALFVIVGCRDRGSNPHDASPDAPAMTMRDAFELESVCAMISQASPSEKGSRYSGDPIEYVRLRRDRTDSAYMRALLSQILAAPPSARPAILRTAYTTSAMPILLDAGASNPSAPTAPWGREDTLAVDTRCALADAFAGN